MMVTMMSITLTASRSDNNCYPFVMCNILSLSKCFTQASAEILFARGLTIQKHPRRKRRRVLKCSFIVIPIATIITAPACIHHSDSHRHIFVISTPRTPIILTAVNHYFVQAYGSQTTLHDNMTLCTHSFIEEYNIINKYIND